MAWRWRQRALTVVLAGVLVAGVLVAGGCGDDGGGSDGGSTGTGGLTLPDWPAPDDPGERAEEAGLEMAVREHLATHRHAHVDVFIDGEAVEVPAGIGIDISDPGVEHFRGPAYGGIQQCENPCISPLHTHDSTGIVHTESQADEFLTLGQFFVEWGVRLADGCVGEFCDDRTDIAFYVDGEEFDGDPAEIELVDLREIAVVIGTAPAAIPDAADFSQA